MTPGPPGPEALPFRRERILAAGLLALLAPVPLVFTEALAPPVFAVWAALTGAHLLFVAKGRILVLPDWTLNVIGLAILVLTVRYRFGLRSLLRAAVVLMLLTALLKLASIRRERDLSLVLWLAAFLVIGSLATSFHVSILPFVAGELAVAWTVLAKWSLWRDLAAAPGEWHRPGASRIPAPRQAAGAAAMVLLAAIPFFLLLPRIRSPYVRGIQADSREIWTGFTEAVDPGVAGVLKLSERVALRIEADAADMALPDSLRLRTLAYSNWDGRTWSKPKGGGRMLPPRADSFVPLAPPVGTTERRGTLLFDLTPLRSRFLPVPSNADAMRLAGSAARRTGYWLERDGLSNVLVPFTPDRNLQYEVTVGTRTATDFREPAPDDPARRAAGSEAIRRFVVEQAGEPGGARTAEAVAGALERYLSTRFSYSLEIPLRGARPVEEFLFRQRRGHCEAFATAMAVALREVGVPTRLVTGFLGAESGLFGNTWVVRGRNAHAWVEVWCGPGRGWRTFDPTPPDGRPGLTAASWFGRLQNVGEDVEFLYDRWVLSFGEADQGDLLRRLREAADGVGAWARAAGRTLAGAKRLGAAAAGLLLSLLAWRWMRVRGTGAPLVSFRTRGLAPGAASYRTARRLLRSRGLPITPATAPSETVAAAATLGPEAALVMSELVGHYLAESFGGHLHSRSEREGIDRLVKELRRVLGKRVKP